VPGYAPEFEALPPPLGDELLFSRIARYAFLIGEDVSARVLDRLVDNRMQAVASGLPCGLSQLESYFFPNCSTAELLVESTHAPYFWPFLLDTQRVKLKASMLGTRSHAVKFSLGIVASRIGAENSLRFCPDCRRSEEAAGIAVWHRAHQLPGILVCHVHGSTLFDASHVAKKSRHRLFLPRDVVDARPYPTVQERHRRALIEVARFSASMLFASLLPIERDQLRSAYSAQLRGLGLLTPMGSTRQARLAEVLRSRWESLVDLPSYQWLRTENWYSSLLRNRAASMHPLKHLLFCRALDLNPSELMLRAMTSPKPEAATRPRRAQHASAKDEAVDRCVDLVVKGMSCRAAAAATGIDVQTVILAVSRSGVAVSRRPKRVDQDLTASIRDAIRAGEALRTIALRLSVSNCTVWRALVSDSVLEAAWNEARCRLSRDAHREKWLRLLSDELGCSIKELRARDGGTYAWLHRHDRDWLSSTVLARIRIATPAPPRSDMWIAKDFRLAIAVKTLAATISTTWPLNGRASRSRLLRELSCEAALTKHPERFPLLLGALARHSESTGEYQVRRVVYWIGRLTRSGNPPAAWLVLKRAGIGKNPSQGVLAALEACFATVPGAWSRPPVKTGSIDGDDSPRRVAAG
jgi:hypothetical protein